MAYNKGNAEIRTTLRKLEVYYEAEGVMRIASMYFCGAAVKSLYLSLNEAGMSPDPLFVLHFPGAVWCERSSWQPVRVSSLV